MQEKNKNSGSLGVCRRVFNFFLDNLLARSVKRVTLSHATSTVNAEMMVRHQDHENPNHDLGSEIQVYFKQYEELDSRTPVHKFANPSHGLVHSRDKAAEAEQEKKHVSKEPPARKNKDLPLVDHPQLQGNSPLSLTGGARSRGAKQTISLRESAEEEQRSKSKGKSIPNENLTLPIQEEEVRKTPRRFRPLPMNVPPNINEKSDAFIRTRREAMSRNLRMDAKASKPT